MRSLSPLDIFFTRGEHWLSRVIRKLTRSKGEPRTVANHVGLIFCSGEGLDAWGIEALASGVKFRKLSEGYGERSEICVFRPVNLTREERDKVLGRAGEFINKPYGYFKLILHALDWCVGGRYIFRRLGRMDSFPICSYVVARAFMEAGKNFGVSDRAASPDDIWDFVIKNLDKYEFVWQQGRMYEEVK